MIELKNDKGAMSVQIEGEYSTVIVLFEASTIDLMLKRGMKYDSEADA